MTVLRELSAEAARQSRGAEIRNSVRIAGEEVLIEVNVAADVSASDAWFADLADLVSLSQGSFSHRRGPEPQRWNATLRFPLAPAD
jgi:hypothetical protein